MRHNTIAGFAALLAVALIAAGALAIAAGGRDDAGTEGHGEGRPYEIDGYRFSHTIGGPLVPTTPVDVAVGGEGRIFVADIGLNRVLAFTPEGALDTSWGDGGMSARLIFPTGIALGPDGALYVLQLGEAEVHVLNDAGETERSWSVGGDEGQASASVPTAIAVDADGTVYVPDQRERQILRYDAGGDELEPWNLPLEDASEAWVRDIAVAGDRLLVAYDRRDGPGGLLALDRDGQPVEMEMPLNAPEPEDELRAPGSLAVDPRGEVAALYLSAADDVAPLVVSPQGAWEPQGIETLAPINGLIPPGIALDRDGRILLADPARQRVRIYAPDGTPAGEIGSPDAAGLLAGLDEIVAGRDGLLYAADPLRGVVLAYEPGGALAREYRLPGDSAEALTTGFTRLRMRLAVDGGGYVYALDEVTGQIVRFAPDGGVDAASWPPDADGGDIPATMLLSAGQERVYLVGVDQQDRVRVFSTAGEDLGLLFEPFWDGAIQDIAVTEEAIYTVGLGAGTSPVHSFSPEGRLRGELADLSRGDGNANRTGFALAPDGRGGLLVAAVNVRGGPEFEYQLLRLDEDGDIERLGTLDLPFTTLPDIAVDPAGRLYVAAPNDQQIYVFEPDTS